jgi:hypothetical protein
MTGAKEDEVDTDVEPDGHIDQWVGGYSEETGGSGRKSNWPPLRRDWTHLNSHLSDPRKKVAAAVAAARAGDGGFSIFANVQEIQHDDDGQRDFPRSSAMGLGRRRRSRKASGKREKSNGGRGCATLMYIPLPPRSVAQAITIGICLHPAL